MLRNIPLYWYCNKPFLEGHGTSRPPPYSLGAPLILVNVVFHVVYRCAIVHSNLCSIILSL